MDNIVSNRDKKPDGARRVAISASDQVIADLEAEAAARTPPVRQHGPPWKYLDDSATGDVHRYRYEAGTLRHESLNISASTWRTLTAHRGPAAARNPTPSNGPEARAFTSLDLVQKILHSSEVDAAKHPTKKPSKKGKTWVDVEVEDRRTQYRVVKELRRLKLSRQADRVEKCGRVLGVRQCLDCAHSQKVQTRCGMWQLCPMCCRRRGRQMAAELAAHKAHVPARKGYGWKMLTLPVKTDKDHARAVSRIGGHFARLWRSFLKCDGAAAFRSLEFGALTGNVHLHVIYYGPYRRQADLSKKWHKITGDSMVTNIKAIKNAGGVAEVAKYAVKMFHTSARKIVKFWQAVKGRQCTQRYGALRGLRGRPDLEYELECELCGSTRYHYTAVVDGIITDLTHKGFP